MKPEKNKKYKEVIKTWKEKPTVPSDVLGSYTGIPAIWQDSPSEDKPVQDGDDL